MSQTLYLSIDAGWPHLHQDCPWNLVEGQLVRTSGQDTHQQWPPATEHVLILSPDQLVYHSVKLPPKVHWKDATAVAMALEDRLVDELDRVVVIPLRKHGDEVVCCTLKRQRLEQLLTTLQEWGRTVVRVEALTEKLPIVQDEWRIFQNEEGHLWLHDGMTSMELDLPSHDAGIPVTLTLHRAQATLPPPARVVLHGVAPTLLQDLESEWGIPIHREAALDWRTTLSNPSPNLLVGDWMPRRKLMTEPAFRTALIVIAACICIQALMTLASLGKTWWSIRQVKSQQLAFWQEVSGNSDKTDKPARQLRLLWQAARARVGESQPNEFIPVLASLAQQLPQAKILSLEYDQGRTIVSWSGTAKDASVLETSMRERGYTAVTQSTNNGTIITALVAKE